MVRIVEPCCSILFSQLDTDLIGELLLQKERDERSSKQNYSVSTRIQQGIVYEYEYDLLFKVYAERICINNCYRT